MIAGMISRCSPVTQDALGPPLEAQVQCLHLPLDQQKSTGHQAGISGDDFRNWTNILGGLLIMPSKFRSSTSLGVHSGPWGCGRAWTSRLSWFDGCSSIHSGKTRCCSRWTCSNRYRMIEPPNAISGGGSNHQALPGFHRPKQKGGQLKKSRDDPLYSQKSPFFFGAPLWRR